MRLTESIIQTDVNTESFLVEYDILGNIIEKADIGTIDYDPVKVHAVSEVVPFDQTNLMWPNNQLIDYNANGKATKIEEGDYELNITYGYDNQRRKSVMTNDGQPVYTRYYLGKYEIEETPGGTKEICYIPGPAGNIAVYVTEGSTSEIYYTLTDHLGSIVAIVDEVGDIIEEQSFDAWGRNRNPSTWEYDNAQPISLLFRGYTGHEMLPEFGLVNMNGRMYDPVLGRMLSPDNYVQSPFFPQNYNRYAYCWNNPLKYTDPSGEAIHFLIPVAIGAVAGYYAGSSMYMDNWNAFSNSWWQGQQEGAWKAGVAGAIVGGALGLGFSYAFGSSLGINGMSMTTGGKSIVGFYETGATTTTWSIASNAFITGTINTLSTGHQTDWDVDAMYKSGLVGVVAGGIGGAVASGSNLSPHGVMSKKGIRTQNYVTNTLSGMGDRFIRSIDANLSTEDIVKNTIWGGAEGAFAAWMFSSDKTLGYGSGLNSSNNPVFSRYFSGFFSSTITSVPGASSMAARIYVSVYSMWMLGVTNEDLLVSIGMTTMFGPWIYLGLSALQKEIIPNYIYGYNLFNPNYWW